jgi:hypothetical protein
MQVKLNPELEIEDFDDGKLITEIFSRMAHYMERGVYDLLVPAATEFVEVGQLFPAEYSEQEVSEFVADLLEKRLLIRRE